MVLICIAFRQCFKYCAVTVSQTVSELFITVKNGTATWSWVDQGGHIPLERDGHNLG